MAAIVDPMGALDRDLLCSRLKAYLPSYAIPLFLRIMKSAPLTGTFKLKKIDLQKDGYDITKVEDKLYFYNARSSRYDELTEEVYEDIQKGKVRL